MKSLIATLLTKIFFLRKLTFICFFLLAIFCSSYFVLKKSPLVYDTSLYLRKIMIRDGGLYVLMGSKPMILFQVEHCMPIGDEACKSFWQQTKKELEELRGPNYFFTSCMGENGEEDGVFIKYLKKRNFESTVKEWLAQRGDQCVRIFEFP